MRHYDQNTFTTKSGRLWWNPELLSRSGSIDCTFEEPAITASSADNITATMACDFDEIVCHFYLYVPPAVSGDMVCSFSDPVFSAEPGRRVVCTAKPWEFQAGIYIPGNGGVMDNCTFKEMKADWVGTSSFVSLDLTFRRAACDMGMGLGLSLETERFDLAMSASVGLVAGIDIEMEEMAFTAVGGGPPEMSCTFEVPAIRAQAETPILSGISLTMQRPEMYCAGGSDIVASLDLRSRPMDSGGWNSISAHGYGEISAQLSQLYAGISGISGPVGNIGSEFILPRIELCASAAEVNTIDAVAREPVIKLFTISDCEEDEILRFEAA